MPASIFDSAREGIYRPRHPARIVLLLFLAFIALGTGLLAMPFCGVNGQSIGLSAALFTATSAVCVTGLSVIDIQSSFSFAGQLVLLLLIQLGGLGYMVASTFLFLLFGRVTLQDQLVLRDTFGQVSLRDTRRLLLRALRFTFGLELLGAALLFIFFAASGRYDWWESAWHAIFHAVSAFCNAGFDIKGISATGEFSLMAYRGHWGVNLVVMVLIIGGGLGFVTFSELWDKAVRRSQKPLSLSTRLILTLTLALIGLGWAFFLFAEWNNPKTLAPLPFDQKILASLFQSVTLRTAGFATIDFGRMLPITLLVSGLFMFIGAAPGGTGGGVKVTTFAAMILAVKSSLRGENDTEIFGKRLAPRSVFRALVVVMLGSAAIVAGTFVLAFSDPTALIKAGYGENLFMRLQFEAISAFATVGLSTGITGTINESGRLALIFLMFLGRLGPTTVAIALAAPRTPRKRRLPETEINLG